MSGADPTKQSVAKAMGWLVDLCRNAPEPRAGHTSVALPRSGPDRKRAGLGFPSSLRGPAERPPWQFCIMQ